MTYNNGKPNKEREPGHSVITLLSSEKSLVRNMLIILVSIKPKLKKTR
jgi:hypothetical protein